jgi:hypothetical protein
MTSIKANDGIAHAQRITGNGVLIVTPHSFEHPSRWYYELQEINYNFGLASNGITPIPNFMNVSPTILNLLHAHRRTSPERLDKMRPHQARPG